MQRIQRFFSKLKQVFSGLPLRAYLLYLLAATVVCTGVTFSSYLSSSSGGDTTRVALFATDVSINIPLDEACYPGCSFEIPIKISNYETKGLTESVCEVSQSYSLEAVTLVGNLPINVEWQNGNSTGSFKATDSATDRTHVLVVTWPINASSTAYEYADEIEVIRVIVTAEQTD